jgi:hypothetical protein
MTFEEQHAWESHKRHISYRAGLLGLRLHFPRRATRTPTITASFD